MGFLSNTDPREKAINQQIQQTHNQINELYLDLGRYVKLNLKDQINDQYVQNAARNIDDCLARLQQLNNDLNSVRGIKLCVNCSAQIPVAVTFCPQCGTKQPDNAMGMNGMMGGMQGNTMNMGMNNMQGNTMNMGMQNTMQGNTMQGGFGAPVPTPVPAPAPAQPQTPPRSQTGFNPASSGNSPANANKNKIGAENIQPMPSAPIPPMNDVPPVPAAPQADNMLKDIPPVPPMPDAKPESAVNEIPPVPPMPEKTEPLTETTVSSDAPTAAPAEAEAPKAAESFVFCSQCGHKEAAGVAFCSQCGSKL